MNGLDIFLFFSTLFIILRGYRRGFSGIFSFFFQIFLFIIIFSYFFYIFMELYSIWISNYVIKYIISIASILVIVKICKTILASFVGEEVRKSFLTEDFDAFFGVFFAVLMYIYFIFLAWKIFSVYFIDEEESSWLQGSVVVRIFKKHHNEIMRSLPGVISSFIEKIEKRDKSLEEEFILIKKRIDETNLTKKKGPIRKKTERVEENKK